MEPLNLDVRIEQSKPCEKKDVLDEIVRILKKLLNYCVCCLSCGCIRPQDNDDLESSYEMILLETEKQAVQNLLKYLEQDSKGDPILKEDHIRALCILTYSDNVELQRSAALCYTEVSEKMKSPLTTGVARPLVKLLSSPDRQVQKSATLAVSNFTLKKHDANKETLVTCGVIEPLVTLLHSNDPEIQCNTCGCITTLATSTSTNHLIVNFNGIRPLLLLLQSPDPRVRRNAAGAVLNLTHLQSHRNKLVSEGVLPLMIGMLENSDKDIQYYSAASISNIAVNEKQRQLITAIGHNDAIKHLVNLLDSQEDKVKCQACYALRNLASDDINQLLIVQLGALPYIKQMLRSCHGDTLTAAVACLRNLSIHKSNELAIIECDLLHDLCKALCDSNNPDSQKHAAGIIRNLAVGHFHIELIENDCIEALTFVLLDVESRMSTLTEVTAALAVLADNDVVKSKLLQLHSGKVFSKLVTLASLASHSDLQYNCVGTLGQLFLLEIPEYLKISNMKGILLFIDNFLKSPDPNFIHIALWSLAQLLKDPVFLQAFQAHNLQTVMTKLSTSEHKDTITELAQSVLHRLIGHEESTSSDD